MWLGKLEAWICSSKLEMVPYLNESLESNPQWPICTIGSRDYCHAPLGVSSFSFSVQNVWEMTTMVYKIACCSCTACPPAIVLRLSIPDTISSATVYSQYVKALRTRQKHGKNTANSTAMIAKQRLDQIKTDLYDLYFDS